MCTAWGRRRRSRSLLFYCSLKCNNPMRECERGPPSARLKTGQQATIRRRVPLRRRRRQWAEATLRALTARLNAWCMSVGTQLASCRALTPGGPPAGDTPLSQPAGGDAHAAILPTLPSAQHLTFHSPIALPLSAAHTSSPPPSAYSREHHLTPCSAGLRSLWWRSRRR